MPNKEQSDIDLSGSDAGSAAAAAAAGKIEELFGDAPPAPAAPRKPAASAVPPTPAAEEYEVEEEPEAAPPQVTAQDEPPETVLPPREEPEVPAHVARKGTKSIETWKALHAELDTREAEVADLQKDRELKDQKIAELEKKLAEAPPEDEVKALRQKLKDQEDEIGRGDITKTKAFQAKYDAPLQQTFAKLVATFKKFGQNEQQSVALARAVFRPGMNDPSVLERALPGDSSGVLVGAVSAILDDREALVAQRETALRDWQATRSELESEESRRMISENSAVLTRASEAAFDTIVKEGSWLYKRGQDPKWNEGVEARRAAAVGYLRDGKPEDIARLVFDGVAAPTYRKMYEQQKGRADDLQAKLTEISTRGRPGLTPRTPETPPGPRQEKPAGNMSEFIDREWEE